MMWLIGMMGAGKSTIGALVADHLNLPFLDTDVLVEERSGRTIPEIFSTDGEEAFRALEASVIADVAAGQPCVVATGGGAVGNPASTALMRESGVVVWLDAPVEVLKERVGEADGRPLLEDVDSGRRLGDLRTTRLPLYVAAAHARFDTSLASPESCAAEVSALWPTS